MKRRPRESVGTDEGHALRGFTRPIPVVDAGQGAELELEDLFQRRRHALNQFRVEGTCGALRVGAYELRQLTGGRC
ncbi:MAG: hypothetical protein WCF36_15015 [Candidatus Nanopelagicales bacterium]